MPEHKTLPNSELHEVKGASTASVGQVMRANGDGTTTFVNAKTLNAVGLPLVLNASSGVNQAPGALDTPIQITFGGAQATPHFSVSALGAITCLVAGFYEVRSLIYMGRSGGAGISRCYSRLLVNGTQQGASSPTILETANHVVPVFTLFTREFAVNDVITFQMLRDSTGINDGGLIFTNPTLAGWNDGVSAQVAIYKWDGVTST